MAVQFTGKYHSFLLSEYEFNKLDLGDAVYVFGSTDSSSGQFDAQIDQNPATSLIGTTSTFRQPALLVGFSQ